MRSQRGQGTVEYVAAVALLAILLVGGVALVSGRSAGIANAVLGEMRQALCVVTGAACPAERRVPCVVASERDARHASVTLFLVRIDADRWVLREKLSDGTVRLTLVHRGGVGVEVGLGVRAKLRSKGRTIGVHDELRAGAQGVLGYGEVYVARDDREANEIQRALRRRIPLVGGGGPDPSGRFVDGGARGLVDLGLGSSASGVLLEGRAESIVGGHRDERTGNVTLTLNAGSAGWALVSSVMAAPSGAADRHVTLGLTLDRARRPIELSVNATGSLAAGATLTVGTDGVPRIRESGAWAAGLRGRRWELGARLDLHDPGVAAAWAAFRGDPTDGDALRALGEALSSRAHLDVRTYAVASAVEGAAVGVAGGLRVGGEVDHSVDRARLVAASARPPGGLWERRWDCVPA